jgi:hypothetical protein
MQRLVTEGTLCSTQFAARSREAAAKDRPILLAPQEPIAKVSHKVFQFFARDVRNVPVRLRQVELGMSLHLNLVTVLPNTITFSNSLGKKKLLFAGKAA